MTHFALCEQLAPQSSHPFFIVETLSSYDGPRSRVVEGRFRTKAEAMSALESFYDKLIKENSL
jgi:hypothetical protein